MIELLDRLREKPKPQRQMIAIVSSIAITGVIAFIWLSILVTQNLSEGEQVAAPEEQASPFGLIRENLADFAESADRQFETLRQLF